MCACFWYVALQLLRKYVWQLDGHGTYSYSRY
jgi:hypothetical protein